MEASDVHGQMHEDDGGEVVAQGRERWAGKLDYLLSIIGAVVGLGNLWRFPYLCYRNGGGAFLIPYLIMLVLVGIPLFFMEAALGQYSSMSFINVWRIAPLFRGVGFCIFFVNIFTSTQYSMILTYSYFYLFASFSSELPWKTCCNEWNTDSCVERHANNSFRGCRNDSSNSTHFNLMTYNESHTLDGNLSAGSTPSQEYWENHVLHMSPGIDTFGTPDWRLSLISLLSYVIVFLCVFKGIKVTGKVVYFTAIFPYVILIILLVQGLTLEGSLDGIMFFIKPRWESLLKPKVWGDAAMQIFGSLGPTMGFILTLASFNDFRNNCFRDTLIISVVNGLTSIIAGFAVFSVLGHMSLYVGVPMENVTTGGPGLAFVAFPEVLATMPVGPFWSIVFFLLLITLGLDSMFANVEIFSCAVEELVGSFFQHRNKLMLIKAATCCVFFIITLIYCCPGGVYLINLIDWYIYVFPLLTIGIFEAVIVSWIYGYRRFRGDIQVMIGFKPSHIWTACWIALTPAILMFLLIFNAVIFAPAVYGEYRYPDAVNQFGLFFVFGGLVFIPVTAIVTWVQFGRKIGSVFKWRQIWKEVTKPASDWDHNRKTYGEEFPVERPNDEGVPKSGHIKMEVVSLINT